MDQLRTMQGQEQLIRKLDRQLAAPMFGLSLVVLALFASLIYLNDLERDAWVVWFCLIGLMVLYPLFWVETAVHFLFGKRHLRQHLWFCLLPITRIGARDHETGTRVWLPVAGWVEVNKRLERKLARRFSVPMIVVALLVLPVIVLEFFYKDFVDSNPILHILMAVAEAFIWAAFTFEFVLMIWVVKYPINHVRKHWIELAIILLPMLAFLRTLRLASIGRLKQLSRTARVFRLRGLGMRMWRGFVALEVIDLLLSRDPERRLAKLECLLEDRMEEVGYLKKDIQKLKDKILKQRAEEDSELPAGEDEAVSGSTASSMAPVNGSTIGDAGPQQDPDSIRQTA